MRPPGGAGRSKARKDTLSLTRSFGLVPMELPLMDYDYDNGKTNPNQVADGYYLGCRGYTLADIAIDELDELFDHKMTYNRMCAYEGHSIDQGGQILDALKFAVVEGLEDKNGEKAYRGQPYLVEKIQGMDWFDSHRVALRRMKSSISVGTIFFPEWQFTPEETGILTDKFVFDGTWDSELGHNYKMSGEKTIGWEPYLRVKMWVGRPFYFNRKTFNKAFDIYGTASFIQTRRQPKDYLYVKLTILQRCVQLIARYISLNFAKKVPQFYQ